MNNENLGENRYTPANKESLVFNFPYNELPNVSHTNLVQIRKCLPYLLEISRNDVFYTNSKAVKYTLEFATSMLASIDNVFVKDTFIELLLLLKEILIRLGKRSQLSEVFPDVTKMFDLLLYVSDLDVFCKYCSNICQAILQELLNSIKSDYAPVDEALTGILENFKKIQADTEVAVISEIILLRLPLEAKAYKRSAYWLMEDSIQILKNIQVERIQDESQITAIIKNIYTFFIKVAGLVNTQSEFLKYQKSIVRFVNDLMDLSPKLIELCCTRIVAAEARQLLGLVLHAFLREQGIMSEEIGSLTRQDIEEFPANVRDWPKTLCQTFFWLCHLLYYHKTSVWTTGEICGAIKAWLYTKQYRMTISVHVLKSVCFIYPISIQGRSKISEKRLIVGDALLNILSNFLPLLHKILSTSECQLYWIMFKGSCKVKMAAVKFWLSSPKENVPVLRKALALTSSEKYLIDVLLSSWDSNSLAVRQALEVIQSLRSDVLLKEISLVMPRFSRNVEVIVALIRACCHETPQDKNIALKIFNSVYLILKTNPDDDVLTHVCQYASNLLSHLKNDEDFIQSVCTNQFWIRYPISRIQQNNKTMVVAILRLLTKILRHQKKPCYAQDPAFIDLASLLTRSPEVVEETVTFLSQLLRVRTPISLKQKHVLAIAHKLCDLTYLPYLTAKVYDCLTGLLQMYPSDLINSPVLGMSVEERCQLSSRRSQSSASLKFVLFWIKLMHRNPYKGFCYLPQKDVVTAFINRSVGLLESSVARYMHFISEIYRSQDLMYEDDDELCHYFNTQTTN